MDGWMRRGSSAVTRRGCEAKNNDRGNNGTRLTEWIAAHSSPDILCILYRSIRIGRKTGTQLKETHHATHDVMALVFILLAFCSFQRTTKGSLQSDRRQYTHVTKVCGFL
jgi:macrodomain Ter protein organizer (MatP/YcbG family)